MEETDQLRLTFFFEFLCITVDDKILQNSVNRLKEWVISPDLFTSAFFFSYLLFKFTMI